MTCKEHCYRGVQSFVPFAGAEVSCWMLTGERQTARMRQCYLRAVLRQEVAFFDSAASSGEIVARISSDTLLIQDAISEKAREQPQRAHGQCSCSCSCSYSCSCSLI